MHWVPTQALRPVPVLYRASFLCDTGAGRCYEPFLYCGGLEGLGVSWE